MSRPPAPPKASTRPAAGKDRPASPVALFLGDPSVVDPLVHAFVDARMAAASQALDFEIVAWGQRPVAEVEASLRQVGMFSPKRCLWLRGLAEAKKKGGGRDDEEDAADEAPAPLRADGGEDERSGEVDRLLAMLEAGIPDGTLLVVSAAALDARGRLHKWFAKHAEVHDRRVQVDQGGGNRGKLSADGLRRAIEERLREAGVEHVGAGVVEAIALRSGTNLGETLQEVERVVLAQKDPSRLAATDVTRDMRDLALGWVFDLTRAVEARDLGAAEQIVERLLSQGEAPLRLVALLASHVAALVAARPLVDALPKGWTRMRGQDFLSGPAMSLPEPWRGWPGYFRLKAAANFSADELRRLHGEVRRLDAALKSSPTSPLLLFSRLLQAACSASVAA